jgi:60 kDa SS-A/Ro ribonucleoprotein
MTLTDAMSITFRHGFGSTDCALPYEWLINNRVKVGGVIVTTDSETGSSYHRGQRHPAQALKAYRTQFVHDCRSIVVGMTSNDFTIADPEDSGMMDVVGFDANAPGVMADFLRGDPVEAPAAEEEE